MYFVVSWDISAVNPTWSQIDEQLRDCFKGLPQLRPVNTFYMVRVTGGDQYQRIMTALQGVAKSTEQRGINVYIIMSPILTVTGWEGWLQPDRWPKVEAIAS